MIRRSIVDLCAADHRDDPALLVAHSPVSAPILRALTLADAQAAAEVIQMAFAAQRIVTRPPSSALRESMASVAAKVAGGGGFGAFADARLIAVALWQAQGDALLLGRVGVLPTWRGRGLAEKLVAACEGEGRRQGLKRLRLRARLELPENQRLFARLGFARIRVEAHEGFAAPTVAVMEKPLP